MQRALGELKAGTWFAGLRRSQSDTRGKLPVLQKVGNQFKLYPIIDWSNKDLHYYLKSTTYRIIHFGNKATCLLAIGTQRSLYKKA